MADIDVLLDNDALKVFFLKGNSDFLVVTFSPMNFNPSSLDDFYCKAPLVKLGISGISITAKQNHWYPEKYMNEAMSYIVQITKQYKYAWTKT
uniref:hypothetical protein n=1 Tax=uncultured Acinetobacter sp. TaxID=165433 RepID=UPI0026291D6E|nr:hypothetical protein [uncultured Acinetobacter sp.]